MVFPKQLLSARSGTELLCWAKCSGFGPDDKVPMGDLSAGGCWEGEMALPYPWSVNKDRPPAS